MQNCQWTINCSNCFPTLHSENKKTMLQLLHKFPLTLKIYVEQRCHEYMNVGMPWVYECWLTTKISTAKSCTEDDVSCETRYILGYNLDEMMKCYSVFYSHNSFLVPAHQICSRNKGSWNGVGMFSHLAQQKQNSLATRHQTEVGQRCRAATWNQLRVAVADSVLHGLYGNSLWSPQVVETLHDTHKTSEWIKQDYRFTCV